MYNINFTSTGTATLEHFSAREQEQILYVLNKVVAEFDETQIESNRLTDIGDGFYIVKVNHLIRVMTKIKDNSFRIINVFNKTNSKELALT